MRRLAPSLGLGLALLAAGCGAGSNGGGAEPAAKVQKSAFAGSEIQGPAVAAPDFALRDQSGHVVRLSAQRGKSVVVAFLYTRCPDVCPLIASNLNTALRRLGPTRADVRVLAVSVDPKNDTPTAVRRYVRLHRLVPQFRYLTGTRARLAPVWKAYHVAVIANRKGSTVGHSAYEVLVDPAGRERVLYDEHVTPAEVLHDIAVVER
jgi:protein SCO1/2